TVIQRQLSAGQNINSAASGGSTPVYTIADLNNVWLMGNVRETDASLIHVGDEVVLSVPALQGREFHARLSWISPSVDPMTRRVMVRAEVGNPELLLKPQMNVNLKILAGHEVVAPAIPRSALIYDGPETHVWVSEADGSFSARAVHVGRVRDTLVEIKDGLSVGDKIVISGALFLDHAVAGNAT
ncbi:MAG TPA: efflux RND transporter periplasmic adaptor subunit, partial [Pseudomonadales bacterium]|nr:efflux RND transporter periplasmic adaptor subunit [Pseudomonadales bacterium]